MKYTVVWQAATEQDLILLWMSAPDQAAVTAACNAIDAALQSDPLGVGESRSGIKRILIEPPLAVLYDVIEDDGKVVVWQVWRWDLPD
jgi:hypothetical protein